MAKHGKKNLFKMKMCQMKDILFLIRALKSLIALHSQTAAIKKNK